MKSARPLLIILGVIVVVCGVGLGLALTPAVQRWALLRAVGARPGLNFDVAGVSAGFSLVSLRGVEVQKGGLHFKLERLDADYSLLPLVFNRRLHIHQLNVTGLVVDASRLTPARTEAAAAFAGAPAVAPGLLARFHLPVELVLDQVRIAGRARLPGAPGSPFIEAEYQISGGKIAPGQEGTLLLLTGLKNPAAGARVAALNAQVSLRATQTAQKTFGHVSLTAVVDAARKNISDQNQLKISAELEKNSTGENYSCRVDTLLRGTAENMLALHAGLAAGGKEYAGSWALKARTAQLEPFFLGGALPDFNAHGEGLFTFQPSTRAVSLSGRLEADVSRLEAIEPAWRAMGAVNLAAQFNLSAVDGVARLRQLEVRLAGEQPVGELQVAQAAEFNWRTRRLQLGGTASGEVLHLNISGLPLAWVRPFVHAADVSGGMITGQFTVTAGPGRLLARSVVPLHIDALSVVQEGRLLLSKAEVSLNAEAVLTGQELQANISGFTLKTPAGDSFTAQVGVTRKASPNSAIAVTTSYTAELPQLLAPWLPLGRVNAAGEADFTLTGKRIELRRLQTSVTDAAGLILFKAEALRPFSLDLATRRATIDEPGAAGPGSGRKGDLLRLTLGHMPLDRLPLNRPGAKLNGTVEQGEFVLSADGEKLILRAESPLKLAEVSLAQGGQPALTGLGIEAQPYLELAGHAAAKVQTGEVTIRTATGATLLTLKGEATRSAETGLHGTLAFNLEVSALASQPLFRSAQAMSQGRASGEIRAALGAPAGPGLGDGASNQVEARLTLNGLVAREGGQTLPVANLSFRAVAHPNGRLSVQAPLLLDRAGQRSDLNFSLELTPAGGGYGLEGKLTGEHVELVDALSLLAFFPGSAAPDDEPAAPAAAEAKATADPVPAWSRFNGQLALEVKSITRGAEWAMTGLTGLVTIAPARLALEKAEAAFSAKSRFAAQGEVRFSDGAQPYQLGGDFSLTEFDAGKFFKALDPGKPATVEGIFSVTGHLAGGGETLRRTLERTRGRFELTSRQGIFRGLQRTSSRVSLTSKAVELGASVLGSILGSQKATKAAEKVAGTAYFVDQLAQNVAELNYDQLNVRLVREESLNLNIEDISLVSPEIRLLGKGTVAYVADKPLLEQPLSVTLALAGRGKIEQLLGKLHLLDGSHDELGYAKTSQPFTLGGTLAKPDPAAFFNKIAASKLTDFFTPEN